MNWAERALWALQGYGSTAVFVVSAIEAVLVPIPTPPFVMGAGAFLVPPNATWGQAFAPMLLKVAVPGAAGTAVGSLAVFWLCFWGGRKAIDRYGRYFGVSWDGVQKINGRLAGQVEIAVLATRAVPIIPIAVVSAAAGILRMGTTSFLLWTFIGSVMRYLMLGYAGFLTRNSYQLAQVHVGHWQRWAAPSGLAVLILGAALWAWRARRGR